MNTEKEDAHRFSQLHHQQNIGSGRDRRLFCQRKSDIPCISKLDSDFFVAFVAFAPLVIPLRFLN